MLPTVYQNFIHLSRYARWLEDFQRREIWNETSSRYFDFVVPYLEEHHDLSIDNKTLNGLRMGFNNLDVVPSMRAVMTAGPAMARDHVAGYNCAYRAIDNPRAFDEILYILMCGTGVGFSVERQFISQLPHVPDRLTESDTLIVVSDSKIGWAKGLRELIAILYSGAVPKWDMSRVRGPGERLKTMGGRASGPEPLANLFRFVVETFKTATGRKLTSLECHDIACGVGDCVVVGGVRRSAMLSLSNPTDQRMRDAKSGEWWTLNPQRMMANNSCAYSDTPDVGMFMREWLSLYDSKSGERGIFNREAARKQAMLSGRRKGYWDENMQEPIEFGTNPCAEIILRSEQLCNLTEVIARHDDTLASLRQKVRRAAILGTMQSCFTNFRYLGKGWKNNCEEERLLGVSLTGIFDCPLLYKDDSDLVDTLEELKKVAVATNKVWAEKLKIPQSTAVTCVKPSGTVSQLSNSASGIHPRYARSYIRRVRQDSKDPMTQFLKDTGIPHEPDVMKPDDMAVFSFPVRAPKESVCTEDISAVEHLAIWKTYQDHWCEHKPSVTINVNEHEWPEVGAWVWNNFDSMSGVSFLPLSGHTYRQAPYEEVAEDVVKEMEKTLPVELDAEAFQKYEQEDTTTGSRDFACVSGACEI